VTGEDELARAVYQKLKARVVSALPADGWSLTEQRLRQEIQQIQHGRGHGHSP
jgi:hypothetical protein